MAVKTGTTGSMQVDTDLVRELAAMLNDTGLSEIGCGRRTQNSRVAHDDRGGGTFGGCGRCSTSRDTGCGRCCTKRLCYLCQCHEVTNGRYGISHA